MIFLSKVLVLFQTISHLQEIEKLLKLSPKQIKIDGLFASSANILEWLDGLTFEIFLKTF